MPDKTILTPLFALTEFKDLVLPLDQQIVNTPIDPKFDVVPISAAFALRREDFLFLSFLFAGFGLKEKTKANPTLVRTATPAFISVVFPQQSIGEQAFYQVEPSDGLKQTPVPNQDPPPVKSEFPNIPVQTRLSGFSWLTFKIPDAITSIPYTLKDLLDWKNWVLQVTPTGIGTNGRLASGIEAPYRLVLAPTPDSVWRHDGAPVDHRHLVELWHTRLTRHQDNQPPQVSVAWSRDFDFGKPTPPFVNPFRTSLTPRQRTELVILSAPNVQTTKNRVDAHKLMLTSLGAYLDLQGDWPADFRDQVSKALLAKNLQGVSISEWRHLATLGRDHYVRVVEEGALFPFGHRAALVTITERRFDSPGEPMMDPARAALMQQMFVVVREPVKEMGVPGVVEGNDRISSLLPFNRVRITNVCTPIIDPPSKPQDSEIVADQAAFWIKVKNEDFKFNLVGEDCEDHPYEFNLPLIFIKDAFITQLVIQAYNKAPLARRQAPIFGRMIAFAPPGASSGKTALETSSLEFGARVSTTPNEQPFRPAMLKAKVRIAAVEQMTGNAATSDIQYAKTYLQSGFDESSNKGGVFAELVGEAFQAGVPLNFTGQAQKSGGMVTPNMKVTGLSRRFGATGGSPLNLAQGNFNPSSYFQNAKLLGGITLDKIIAVADPSTFGDGKVPTLQRTSTPTALETVFSWTPQMQDHSILKFNDKSKGLTLNVRLRTNLNGGPPEVSTSCELRSFQLNFVGAIEIHFDSLLFNQPAGQKMDVSAKLSDQCVKFGGPLAFLNALAALVHPESFVDPPSLDVDASGARLGYSIGLPPLTIGAYALQNVTLGAAVNIPFSGEAIRVRFAFCERHSPFMLTISGFAGGGFVGIGLGADGIESIEAALEFGGNIALSLGMASGGVCVMGGFYFASEHDSLTFTAYVRATGALEVLSLIAISMEFYLGLSYSKDDGHSRFWGQATVTVEVEVAFFSKSVSMTVTREFASGGDPTFQQLTSPEHYQKYRAAFAA